MIIVAPAPFFHMITHHDCMPIIIAFLSRMKDEELNKAVANKTA